jgi:hypothetical protein
VAAVHTHPNYDATNIVNDMALLQMARNAPAGVTPVPLLPANMALTSADVGTTLRIVGFGLTNPSDNNSAGTKNQVTEHLGIVCGGNTACYYQQGEASPRTICFNQQPGGSCSGDSGGPAFLTRNGVTYVAGVTSYGDQNCAYFGCSTKVDAFQAFWGQYVGGGTSHTLANGSSCGFDTDCTSGHCIHTATSAICCESTCNGACQACNAQGRCTTAADGTTCSDGNRCTRAASCQGGTCTATSTVTCSAPAPCHTNACNPLNGSCVSNAVRDGTACTPADVCTASASCRAGQCTGTPVVCDPPDGCHGAGACDVSQGGCWYPPIPDGTDCGANRTCQNGVCTLTGPVGGADGGSGSGSGGDGGGSKGCLGCSGTGAAPALLLAGLLPLGRRRRR